MPPERVQEGELTKKQMMIQKMEESRNQAAIINHKRRRGEPSQSQIIAFDAVLGPVRYGSSMPGDHRAPCR